MTNKPKPRRVVSTGNQVCISVGKDKDSTRVTSVTREYRFALNLQNISRHFANCAKKTSEDDYWEVQAYVTGAICMAYAGLEAALNEFVHLNALHADSPLGDPEREVIAAIAAEDLVPAKGANTLQRFNLMLRVIGKVEMPTGQNPYQAANLVRCLRNILTHPLPETVKVFDGDDGVDLSSQQEIVKRLRPHLTLNSKATFPESVLVPKCAVWAVQSCENFLRDFVRRSGVDPGFSVEDE